MQRSRIAAIGATLALSASLAGGTIVSAQDEEMEPLKIGFVTHVLGNPFIQQIIDGAQFAADDLGIELQVAGPEGGSGSDQLALIQGFENAGVDGIVTSVPGSTLADPINEIIAAGTPVVQFNLLDLGVNAPYVGERSVESGRILGNLILDRIGGAEATGKVFVGNCFPGFPVLDNRSKGVREALATAPGVEVNPDDFDVKVAANENYAAWEAILTANPDALALIGLCAPDIASLGALQAANPDLDFAAGGYDLTTENIAALQAGSADVSLGQTPFMQGYLPVKMLYDVITGAVDYDLTQGGFIDAGTEIAVDPEVTLPYDLGSLTLDDVLALAADPDAARAFYQPLVDGVIANWVDALEPIENEAQ